jgi:hypothetical protein
MLSELGKMLDDMRLRGFSPSTLGSYAMHVRQFQGFFGAPGAEPRPCGGFYQSIGGGRDPETSEQI